MATPKPIIGVCEICGGDATDRDHDHVTGRIRGLLCASCNRAIGWLRDDPLLAEVAAVYLRRPATGAIYAANRRARDAVPKSRYAFAHKAQLYARHATRMIYDDEYAERHRARIATAQRALRARRAA